jgi:branched-chain amino acid transport system substrate-binding protein
MTRHGTTPDEITGDGRDEGRGSSEPGQGEASKGRFGAVSATFTRRSVLGIVALGALAACSSSKSSSAGGAGSTTTASSGAAASGGSGGGGGGGTIKIGVLRPSTGTLASNGKDMEAGWNLFWEQNGTTVAGKKVETVFADSAANPSIGLTKANQLAKGDNVNMIVGPLSAAVGLAVAAAMAKINMTIAMPCTSSDDLTQRTLYPNFVRLAGWTSSQTTHPFGEWAYEQGYRNILTLGADYAFGWETVGGFANTFTDKGGKIVKQLWAPLGTTDFSTYIAQIGASKQDAVFYCELGGDEVNFFKAYKQFGLYGKTPLIGSETTTDQSVLRTLGDNALGLITCAHFAEGRDAAETKKFGDDYYAKYNRYPSYYAAGMYTAARGVAEAIKSLNGDVSNADAVVKAIKAVSLTDTPFGPEKVDSYGNPIFNVYVRKVENGPHGPWNVPIKTYENVSQFWHYDPKEFLAHPVYTKNYQGNGVWPDPK